MITYIIRRLFLMVPTLWVISVISFAIIQLPPGDYLTSYVANLQQSGESADEAVLASLRARYGLDRPLPVQYLLWMKGVLHGDFGQSFSMNKPVKDLIWGRLGLTATISLCTILFTWIVAVPIGIYSATHRYNLPDYLFTLLGFIGMATPPFMLALLLMNLAQSRFGLSMGGLFSDAYINAPWSLGRIIDLLKHLWVPVVVLGLNGTAGLIRTVRGNLLDQLEMPYVVAARASGLSEWRLLLKYPVRVAINPVISTVGWMLPHLISGNVIVALVLSLPTTEPLFLKALMEQDMYLAGSFVLLLSALTVVGTLISDILLAWVDPRIRFEKKTT